MIRLLSPLLPPLEVHARGGVVKMREDAAYATPLRYAADGFCRHYFSAITDNIDDTLISR